MSASLLALDFDGVLCDGLGEYWQSACLAYGAIWGTKDDLTSYELAFRQLRPVIEVGWEMPLLIRALVGGYESDRCLHHWPEVVTQVLTAEAQAPETIAQALDGVRDRQITDDLDTWLHLHRFYPGVIPWLQEQISQRPVYVITTKEGRFTQALLQGAGVTLDPDCIWGKEVKRSKADSLSHILQRHQLPPDRCHFLEDRLPTLQKVRQRPELGGMHLYLATWGYTTAQEIAQAQGDPAIQPLALGDLPHQAFS